jgi:histidinol dehydrogenase
MKVILSTDRSFKVALKRVTSRSNLRGAAVENAVKGILKGVEKGGDNAVARYVKKFDRASLKPAQFRVSPEQVKEAYYQIRKEEGDALRLAAQRIMAFHERQRSKTWMYQDQGATLGQVVMPLDAVGIYVPGGKAAYPSSVLMCAIPAKVAGVKRVVMCTPMPKGGISPYLLVAADIAGVDEVYRIGGVQAIGAMAYGTKTIARVDKIVGPGNIYVATAKRLMYARSASTWWRGPASCWSSPTRRPTPRTSPRTCWPRRSTTRRRRSGSSRPRRAWPRKWSGSWTSSASGAPATRSSPSRWRIMAWPSWSPRWRRPSSWRTRSRRSI